MADACLAAAQVAQAVVAQQAPPPGASRVCVIPRLPLSELLYASGVVRALCGRGFDVMVVVHRDHANYVRRVFTGLPGVRFAFVRDWTDLHRGVLDRVQAQGYALLPLPSYRTVCPYASVGLPAALAATEFKIERHLDAERSLLDRVRAALDNKPYAVVHDAPGRRIHRHLVPARLRLVHVDDPRFRTASILDWIQVMDHAAQVHGVDSCFLMLATLLSLRPRKFCHAYADGSTQSRPPVYGDAITVRG